MKFLGMAQAEKPLPANLRFLQEPMVVPEWLKVCTSFDLDTYKLAFQLNALL